MGKFGVRGGQLHTQNLQAGAEPLGLDSSGDGETSVVFNRSFKNVPHVVLTSNTAASNETVTLIAKSITKSGFTLRADGGVTTSGATTSSVSVAWIAFDDTA